MDGFELAIRFSYMPNALRYCGPKEANRDFMRYICSRKDSKTIADDLKRFEGLFPYLDAIAQKSGKKFTDYEVVEAYWLGNKLLDKFDSQEMKQIIAALAKRGLPSSVANSRSKSLPKGMFPHHNFNVCYIGVGQTTGAVPTTLENMNNCMINSGIVKKVGKNKLVVAKKLLEKQKGKLVMGKKLVEAEVTYLPLMLPKVKVGNVVALHWNFAPSILTKQQVNSLTDYTERLLKAIT
jgi:hypothetical protein